MTPGCLPPCSSPEEPPPHAHTHSLTHALFLLCLLRAAAGSVHRHLPRCLPLPASPRSAAAAAAGNAKGRARPRGELAEGTPSSPSLSGSAWTPSLDVLSPKTPSPASAVVPAARWCWLLRGAAPTSPGFHQLFLHFAVAGQQRQREAELPAPELPKPLSRGQEILPQKVGRCFFSRCSCSPPRGVKPPTALGRRSGAAPWDPAGLN